jgi:hypothetical protein
MFVGGRGNKVPYGSNVPLFNIPYNNEVESALIFMEEKEKGGSFI